MRIASLLVAASLLSVALVALPGVDATREPVGGCGEDVIVEICAAPCFYPPCPVYVCVDKRPVTRCF